MSGFAKAVWAIKGRRRGDGANEKTHPGATEVCDGVDNNCDGTVDEGCPGANNGDLDVTADAGLGTKQDAGPLPAGDDGCRVAATDEGSGADSGALFFLLVSLLALRRRRSRLPAGLPPRAGGDRC